MRPLKYQSVQVQKLEFFTPRVRLVILGFLFIAAFGIRFYHINKDTQFHQTRQYRSAIITRAYYFDTLHSIPEWRRNVAILNKQMQGIWEPPIIELLAAFAFKIAGEEQMWIPRSLSSIFWLVGGSFLFLLARMFISSDAALLCVAFYLFVPFGIHASGSFQPDALMVMGLLISAFTTVRYYAKQSSLHFLIALVVAALAISTKFVSLFPILGVFISIGIYTEGFRTFIRSPRHLGFSFLSILPAIIFYSYGLFISKSLTEAARLDIMPHLLIQPFFWTGWAKQIELVVGLPAMIGALLGTLMLRDKLAQGLLIGLWSGYFVFGLIFSYTVSTHDYWNLQIIPIVALSIGPIAVTIMDHLCEICFKWYMRAAIACIAVLIVLFSMYNNRHLFPRNDQQMKTIAQEIGELVGHSTQTIFLAEHYGKSLVYHGEIVGTYWPRSIIDWKYRRSDERKLTVQERLDNISFIPKYFIITAFEEFKRHHVDLGEFLDDKCLLLAKSEHYLIYGNCARN